MKSNGQSSKFFEVTITAVGIFVTAVLGYGQWRLGQQQNAILENQAKQELERSIDNIEVQVMTLVSPHLGKLASAGEEAETAQKVVLAAAEYLSNQYGRTSLASMATMISEGNPTISQPIQDRFEEATVAPPQLQMPLSEVDKPPPKQANWYAVLASLPGDQLETAKAEANKKLDKAREKGLNQGVQLYKTEISNNYAVVIGGALDKASARALSAKARTVGLSRDSFPQIDKEWTHVGDAPF
jgi:hypothetical protein